MNSVEHAPPPGWCQEHAVERSLCGCPGGEGPGLGRRARITWASEIEIEPVVWAWQDAGEGRLPAGALALAAGREGTGKSSFGIWLAAQVTRGTLPGSFHGTPRRVFYVAVEDSWKHTLAPRLLAAGADMSLVGRFDVVTDVDDEVTLSLPLDNGLLEREIIAHQAALVVIDPLMSVIDARIDSHRTRDVRTALDPLAKLADRTGSVLLGVAHFNKSSGTDVSSLITGAGAFKDVPRAVLGFVRDESEDGSGRVMSQSKNSLGKDDLPSLRYRIETATVQTRKGDAETGRFVWDGVSDRTASEILRDSRSGEDERDERGEAAEWLTSYLEDHGGSCEAGEAIKAAAAAGIAKTTLTRARKTAGVSSAKGGFGQGWTWTLGARRDHEGTEEPTSQNEDSSVPSADSSTRATPGPGSCPDCGQAISGSMVCCVECALARARARPTPPPGSTCPECGEPLTEPGATARCRPSHAALLPPIPLTRSRRTTEGDQS